MSDDPYPNAGRESGYVDEDGKPVGENIINRVTQLMVGPQTKLVQLAAQLDAIVKQQDQRFDYVLRQLSAHLEKEDRRHDAYDQAEQTTLDALTSIAQRLDQVVGYVQQSVTIAREAKEIAQEALTVSKENGRGLGKTNTQLNVHTKKLKEVAARLDRKREELDRHAERIRALEDNNNRLDALEAEVRRLSGAHG